MWDWYKSHIDAGPFQKVVSETTFTQNDAF